MADDPKTKTTSYSVGTSISRWPGESLREFADRLVERIEQKIYELNGCFADIANFDLDEDNEEDGS